MQPEDDDEACALAVLTRATVSNGEREGRHPVVGGLIWTQIAHKLLMQPWPSRGMEAITSWTSCHANAPGRAFKIKVVLC